MQSCQQSFFFNLKCHLKLFWHTWNSHVFHFNHSHFFFIPPSFTNDFNDAASKFCSWRFIQQTENKNSRTHWNSMEHPTHILFATLDGTCWNFLEFHGRLIHFPGIPWNICILCVTQGWHTLAAG